MPSISVRAYAELIHTPLYGQLRILQEQKYPKQAPGIFKIQYYRPALQHIRRYYHSHDAADLPMHQDRLIGAGKDEARIEHNLRVLKKFKQGQQSGRSLILQEPATFERGFSKMTIRATPDLMAEDAGTRKYILYDMRCVTPDEEIIRTTVELFHYIMQTAGEVCPTSDVEYVCIDSNKVFKWKSTRKTTIKRARDTARGIIALWDSI